MIDPIADLIARIRNAGAVGKPSVVVPHSAIKQSILEILAKEGLIQSVEKKGKKVKKHIEIVLAYDENKKHKIKGMERISKFSRRKYSGFRDLRPIKNGFGFYILTTPKGILTDKEAKKEKVGGEVLLSVW